MYNKYYRLNESRWELPEEDDLFKYPDYGYDKEEYNYIKEKNLKEGWDKDIKEELEWFYKKNKKFIITDEEKLFKNFYEVQYNTDKATQYYIDFCHLTLKEKEKLKYFHFQYDLEEDKTYLVREVIRRYPNLNPSDILFDPYNYELVEIYFKDLCTLSKNLSCIIKNYTFKHYDDGTLYPWNKYIIINGIESQPIYF